MEELLHRILNELGEIKSEIVTIKSEMADMKSEMADMKSEMATIKSEMTTMKSEMATIKSEMADMKSEMATMKSEMANKTQQEENTALIKALLHRTDELDAKFDGLLLTTVSKEALSNLATKDDIRNLDAKISVLTHHVIQQEADLYQLKQAR